MRLVITLARRETTSGPSAVLAAVARLRRSPRPQARDAVARWDRARALTADLAGRAAAVELSGRKPYRYRHGWIPINPADGDRPHTAPAPDAASGPAAAGVESMEGRAARLTAALAHATPTDVLYHGPNGWTPERAAQQKAIVDDLWAAASAVPDEGKAIIAGGLGGSGKSTVLGHHLGVPPGRYLTLNPDDIKEEMARRGMIPELPGFSPMEGSALIHEESSYIANQLARRAYAARKNVIWDITMASRESVTKRIDALRASSYGHVGAVFVDVPVETSVQRAMARYARGVAEYRDGTGFGGRYVPPDLIRANADPEFGSRNRRAFTELEPRFDGWAVYDSSTTPSRPVTSEGSVQ